MGKKSEQTKLRILEAAYYLFYRQGFTRVNVDAVAARAGLTKRTLYAHFRSKDDLLAAALRRNSALEMKRLGIIADGLPPRPDAMLDAYFGQLVEWAGKPRWSGSGFTRVVVELADLRGHPARAIARLAKAGTESWLADLLAKRGVPLPRERAREVMLLTEGAMALMLIHGDRSYGDAAARAAKRLVKRK
jgi:AcrR family transcriptional regulator